MSSWHPFWLQRIVLELSAVCLGVVWLEELGIAVAREEQGVVDPTMHEHLSWDQLRASEQAYWYSMEAYSVTTVRGVMPERVAPRILY